MFRRVQEAVIPGTNRVVKIMHPVTPEEWQEALGVEWQTRLNPVTGKAEKLLVKVRESRIYHPVP